MLLEKGPRRHDKEECEYGSAQANVDCELDVLENVSDDEGKNL